ncbi:MAG: PKD domain-containing protein [Candidatus Aminicenantes bacterium]|nr:PKD domain-containing protein [Candidatus Aminicenantes bacterium]NIM77649.1 PKD domain-containing protein [Candidatus Aminicenantes bacterium]NIN16961.1 PKD domain-containing protein [Candidatus Aminicenantes bacterium]NIN40854.1 PKD domain-containing protein [Candidatus Aminicenantes bacterium]NIN83658.1 PKD domain-containing protein [Candidatus Aminicenantes bacterium]
MNKIKKAKNAVFSPLFLAGLLILTAVLFAVPPPVADAGPDQTVNVDEVVTFDGSGSYAKKGTIVSYEWNFGDGNTASGMIVTHAYTSEGTYSAVLTVTDSNGGTDDDTAVITVGSGGGTEPDPGSVPKGMRVYVTGNPDWVVTSHQAGTVHMGGGPECDEAMAWLTARTNGGDFVVIRTDRSDGYQDYIYNQIGGVDSVHTLVINKVDFANATYTEQVIKNAEALWIAGGDQKDYYDFWNDTKVESAIDYLVNVKNAAVGGTSAGLAILGQIDYIPESYGVYSSEALSDPYHEYMNYRKTDFITQIPFTSGIITDSHLSERDRLGRTITFMARNIVDGFTTVNTTKAIGCDEGAAVCVDGNGQAKIFGWEGYTDYVFFLKADTTPDVCQSGTPLHWTDAVTVYKVRGFPDGSNTFNLVNWNGTGGTWESVNVNNGAIDNDIQEPD